MSYFLPGVSSCYFVRQLFPNTDFSLKTFSEAENSIIYIIVATLMGFLLHRITFWIVGKGWIWYKSLIYKPINIIVESEPDEIKPVFEHIKSNYIKDTENAGIIFDRAYIYLECNDKISSAKAFQSMYFLIRNHITLAFLLFPVALISFLKFWYSTSFWIGIACLLFVFVFGWVGSFFRMKMVDRVFNTFYVDKTYNIHKRDKTISIYLYLYILKFI